MGIREVLDRQDGVVARRQVLEAGETDQDIRRRLARREWATVHPGVYVDHTGPPTWRQSAWAAVLFYWPAYLGGASALHAAGVRGFEPRPGAPVFVCVDRTRSIRRRVGITVHQIAGVDRLSHDHLSPPRESVEHALLDVAARKKRLEGSIAVLSDAVQCGCTTPGRLLEALEQRPKLRYRGLLREVLTDVGHGVRSVLEHRYLRTVERAHGLPAGTRQTRRSVAGKVSFSDVDYDAYRVTVELDGRLGHDRALDRWADLDRDLAAAVASRLTLRIGWAQVLDSCRVANTIGAVLAKRGWTGLPRSCGPECTTNSSPGRGDVAQTG